MFVKVAESHSFPRFKQHLFALARDDLNRTSPNYLPTFEQAQGRTVDMDRARAAAEAKPYLDERWNQKWAPLLEAVLDFESTLNNFNSAALMLSNIPANEVLISWGMQQSSWMIYHSSRGLLEAHSLLEAMERLVKITCRKKELIPSPVREGLKIQLTQYVEERRREYHNLRLQVAHGWFLGAKAITREKLWPLVVTGHAPLPIYFVGPVEPLQKQKYDDEMHKALEKQRWVFGVMALALLEQTDTVFKQLDDNLPPPQAK